MTKFELSDTQEEKLKAWKDAIFIVFNAYGSFEFRFTSSGIGDKVEVYSTIAKTTLDLTEVENW